MKDQSVPQPAPGPDPHEDAGRDVPQTPEVVA